MTGVAGALAPWGAVTRRERMRRGGLVLVAAVVLHVGAAAMFMHHGGVSRGGATGAPVATAMVWVIGAQAPVAAATVAVPSKPKVAAPKRTAKTVEETPQRAVEAVREEPTYQVARRSLAFGGSQAARDDTTATPSVSSRPLAAWLQEGIARSVWPVAETLVAAGDGVCRARRGEATLSCETASLDAALAAIEPGLRRSLLTWVESGLAGEIEIRVQSGTATYSVR